MAYQNALVKTVIQILHDGQKGFVDIGEHFKDPTAKAYFMQEAQTRGAFATELEAEYGTDSGESNDIGGTAAGAIHRVWGDLKANLGGGDHTLLDTAEQGEDAAKKAYKEALEDTDVSGSMRSLLQRQQQHIQASHDKVKAMRDSTS